MERKITVSKGPDGEIRIDGIDGETPSVIDLFYLLPVKIRRAMKHYRYSSCRALVSRGHLSYQELADLLACHLIRTNETEGVSTFPSGEALLVQGDTLYRLHPLKKIDGSRAIAALREKVRKELALEKRKVAFELELQKSEAAALLRNARSDADYIRREARRETLGDVRIPISLRSQFQIRNEAIQVKTMGMFSISEFRYDDKIWYARDPKVVSMEYWMVFSQDFTEIYWDQFHVDKGSAGELPHMRRDMCCVEVADRFEISKETVASLIPKINASLVRAFQVVNLASLASGFTHWNPTLKECVPTELVEYLEAVSRGDDADVPEAEFTRKEESSWSIPASPR